jgi:uncharacterized protein
MRGFALAGILLVHFPMITEPGGVDVAVSRTIGLFVEGSIYPVFAMLFGLGFAVQFDRWDARGAPALRRYLRRVLGLFLFGLAIWCLFWPWWTLVQYSVAALALIPFRRAKPRVLLLAAATIFVLQVGVVPSIQPLAPQGPQHRALQQAVGDLQGNGPYPALLVARARLLVPYLVTPWFYLGPGTVALPLLLVGAAIGRSRILAHPARHLVRLRRIVVGGAVVGVTANLVIWWRSAHGLEGSGLLGRVVDEGLDVGDMSLGLAYAAGIVILHTTSDRWRRLLAPLTYVGRTSLSNVVLQWAVISTLYFGYAFGHSGRIGAVTGVPLIVLIFGVEIWLSRWWLTRYRFGPLEWIWRTLTYWERTRSRRTVVVGA